MKAIEDIYEIFKHCSGVCIDSRKIKDSQMFFAFKGENTDGHKYVEEVLSRDQTYAVIDDPLFQLSDRCILVDNVLETLQWLARYHRDQFDIPVFALTGSNGKTTTKELIMAVLKTAFSIHATEGNLNNHIGVPLTLLNAKMPVDIMIIEMGANKIGDIEELCQIADPDIGLITNIGTAHIEGFGSQENILIGKTELYRHIGEKSGGLLLNKLDEKLVKAAPDNTELHLYPMPGIEIRDKQLFLEIEDLERNRLYTCQLYGSYNAGNIHAALCTGAYFGVDRTQALEAISAYQPRMNRSQVEKIGSSVLILDAYNANPSSMKLSIETLGKSESADRKILVIGDMLELGKDEIEWHETIIELIKTFDWAYVALIGKLFEAADKDNLFEHFSGIDAFLETYAPKRDVFEDSTILIKASRSMQLEKFRSLLLEN